MFFNKYYIFRIYYLCFFNFGKFATLVNLQDSPQHSKLINSLSCVIILKINFSLEVIIVIKNILQSYLKCKGKGVIKN